MASDYGDNLVYIMVKPLGSEAHGIQEDRVKGQYTELIYVQLDSPSYALQQTENSTVKHLK